MDDAPRIRFRYRFEFDDGRSRVFEVKLDGETLALVPSRRDLLPQWTRLEPGRCSNCPLDPAVHSHCPLAVELVDLVEFFSGFVSHESVRVHLETEEREYSKRTSVQQGASSLLGIYMVSSGCPVLARLRPMVRFHLPFASIYETAYRAISMYLTAQFFRQRRGLDPDWELRDLASLYEQVQIVNRQFCDRLRRIESHDANANALVILDNFANYVALVVSTELLDEMEPLFAAFLERIG